MSGAPWDGDERTLHEALPDVVGVIGIFGRVGERMAIHVYAPDHRRCELTAAESVLPLAEVGAMVCERCGVKP